MDGLDPIPLIKAFLPKVPLVGKTVLSHTLGLSDTSKSWDLRTEVTVKVLRSFITGEPQPISKTQHLSLKAGPIKGKIWISKTTAPIPAEDDLREKLWGAIEDLKEEGHVDGEGKVLEYFKSEYTPVEAEWTGYRAGATKNSPELRITESEKYKELMKEATSPTTVLYFHGGAYYLMDPASHRPTCVKLAKLTRGRCYSVRYRLAPQNPFPAALLDALVSYFTLLHPPAGSFHTAVKPEHIVLAGDSAGGNLATVLLVTLLHWHRNGTKILWHGKEIDVPLPAGAALNSPWMDITHSSPSCETNGKWDYLPSRSIHPSGITYPSDNIWPPKPPYKPRKTIYADDCLLLHPLTSPLGITVDLWKKLGIEKVPVFMCWGQELLQDEDRHVAGQIVRAGGKCVVQEWEAMPHCFAMVFEGLDNSRLCFEGWGKAIQMFVEKPEEVVTSGVRVRVKGLKEEGVVVEGLSERTEEQVWKDMKERSVTLGGETSDPISKL